jgi:hypothetical protein
MRPGSFAVKKETMSDLGTNKLLAGTPLEIFERFRPDDLSHAATAFVESLRINSVSEKTRSNCCVIIKRRNMYGERVAELINLYFRMAGIGIHYVSDALKWQQREITSFRKLNGDHFHADITAPRTIMLDKMPGKSLWDHMNAGTLTLQMLAATGRAYRRAHAIRVNKPGDTWSHGDASMANVVYDEKARCARLVDFEMMHKGALSPAARRADDLLALLLDMVDRVPGPQWLPFTICFLRAYDNVDLMPELRKRLVVPGHLASIWWNVRTNFARPAKVKRRLASLRRAIRELEIYLAARARARHRRCPSNHCQ